MCRLWSRVAAGDAVWRPVWLQEARSSLRFLESRFAAPNGAGFRAAVAQLRTAALLSCEPEWRLEDYKVAVDVSWRGRPLFSGVSSLDLLEFDDTGEEDGAAMLEQTTALQPDESYGPFLLRTLTKLHLRHDTAAGLEAETAAASHQCNLRIVVCRDDGAMACLAGDEPCKYVATRFTESPTPHLTDVALSWRSAATLYGVEDEGSDLAFGVQWAVHLTGLNSYDNDEEAEGESAPFSKCRVFFENAAHGADLLISPELLLSGLATLKWVHPVGATALAVAAQARQTAAEAEESDEPPADEQE